MKYEPNGYVMIKGCIDGENIAVLNVHAKPKSPPSFLMRIAELVSSYIFSNIIIGGDWQ